MKIRALGPLTGASGEREKGEEFERGKCPLCNQTYSFLVLGFGEVFIEETENG